MAPWGAPGDNNAMSDDIFSLSTYPQLVSLVTVKQDLSVIGDLLDVGPVVVEAHVTHQKDFTCQCHSLLSI